MWNIITILTNRFFFLNIFEDVIYGKADFSASHDLLLRKHFVLLLSKTFVLLNIFLMKIFFFSVFFKKHLHLIKNRNLGNVYVFVTFHQFKLLLNAILLKYYYKMNSI